MEDEIFFEVEDSVSSGNTNNAGEHNDNSNSDNLQGENLNIIPSSEETTTGSTSTEVKPAEEDKKEFANKQFEKENKEAPSSEKDDSSTLSVFAKYLKEEGVLSENIELGEDINSVEQLKELIVKQIEESKYSNLSESQKRYLETVETGVPLDEFKAIEQELRNLESISQERFDQDDQLRFDLMVHDYMSSGMSQERAEELSNRSFELNKDKEDALAAISNLINTKQKEYDERLATAKEAKKLDLEDVKKQVFSKKEVLGSIELDDKIKAKVYDIMTTKVDVDENDRPLNAFAKWRKDNGVEAEIILNALYIHTNGFKNLGAIERKQQSSAARVLEQKMRESSKDELFRSLQRTASNNDLTIDI